jgi:hypothetical protein
MLNLAQRVAEATELITVSTAEEEAPLTHAEVEALAKIEKMNKQSRTWKHLRFTVSPVGQFRRIWDLTSV